MTHLVRRVSSGSAFEALAGYSRAIVDGDTVHVSGTTGFDYATMTIDDDLVVQTHRCFTNITAALAQAGATLDHVVRVRYLLVDATDFDRIAPIFGQYFAACAAGCDGDGGRAGRPADADRDRGHGPHPAGRAAVARRWRMKRRMSR